MTRLAIKWTHLMLLQHLVARRSSWRSNQTLNQNAKCWRKAKRYCWCWWCWPAVSSRRSSPSRLFHLRWEFQGGDEHNWKKKLQNHHQHQMLWIVMLQKVPPQLLLHPSSSDYKDSCRGSLVSWQHLQIWIWWERRFETIRLLTHLWSHSLQEGKVLSALAAIFRIQ